MNRGVTLTGYALLAAAIVGYQVFGILTRRTPTLGQTVALLVRSTTGRLVVLAGWLWLGWHLFVRSAFD